MRVQARAGAKHVKHREYYFDPKSSGYPEAHRQTPMMAGRYAHAKQFKRHQRQLRFLRARLGRLIRDIGRKIAGQPQLQAAVRWPLTRARQIRSQRQHQRGWKFAPIRSAPSGLPGQSLP
jgi:ATP phosphoribosyltransferase regulatory subunit HisZ